MPDQPRQPSPVGRVQELFDELRAANKSNDEIFTAAYRDLKLLAHKMLSRQPAGNSMNASRLLSDLWMRQYGRTAEAFDWESGAHFFNGMARAMRLLLIDHARQRKALRRGNGAVISMDAQIETDLDTQREPGSTKNRNWIQEKADQALELDEGFRLLEEENPRQATIVELRVYAGLTEAEAAGILGVSSETITKEFAKAKRRLAQYLQASRSEGQD